ncbi:MAG: PQQ-binding-like beta-propeller repeat protein [Burkholderiaceae bacterium]
MWACPADVWSHSPVPARFAGRHRLAAARPNEIERISDVVGQPVVAGREICAASFQGRVACFDAATGRTDWARGLEAVGGIDVDASLVVACADDGRVYAYGRNGAPAWEQKSLKRRLLSAPLMSGAQVFVGDQLGVVHAIDRADGRLVGRFSTDSTPIVSGPVGLGDRVLIQTSGGGLYAIGTG